MDSFAILNMQHLLSYFILHMGLCHPVRIQAEGMAE